MNLSAALVSTLLSGARDSIAAPRPAPHSPLYRGRKQKRID
jgi:hypothetical protein